MPTDEALRAELLEMARRPAAPGNADRLWAVLDDYDTWPGFRLVGVDGAHAAWMIAQLGDADLQRRCLGYLEVAVDNGDAHPAHYACLLDRLRMTEGRPQLYGSQFVVGDDGEVTPWPIERPTTVDARRARVGMVPLAEQCATMRGEYVGRGRPLWPVGG